MKRQYLRHYSKHMVIALRVIDTIGEALRKILANFSSFWRQWNPFPEPRKILVMQSSTVGDTVMTIPAFNALRSRFPNAHLAVLAEPSIVPLLMRLNLFDQIIFFTRPHFRYDERILFHTPVRLLLMVIYHFRYLASLLRKALELRMQKFDLAIDFDGEPRRALLAALAGIPIRVGVANGGGAFLLTHPVDLSDEEHELGRRIQVCSAIGANNPQPVPLLAWTQDDEMSLRTKLEQYQVNERNKLVVLCPFAGFPSKEWRPQNWAQVADYLSKMDNVKVVLCGAPNERSKADAIKSNMHGQILDFVGLLTLPELVVLLHRCDLMIGVDSGPMHIAAALGVPMIIVWSAQSLPHRFGPIYSKGEFVLLWKRVPCANCRLFHCPKPISCMDMITPEEVITVAVQKLQETGATKR